MFRPSHIASPRVLSAHASPPPSQSPPPRPMDRGYAVLPAVPTAGHGCLCVYGNPGRRDAHDRRLRTHDAGARKQDVPSKRRSTLRRALRKPRFGTGGCPHTRGPAPAVVSSAAFVAGLGGFAAGTTTLTRPFVATTGSAAFPAVLQPVDLSLPR